jgi:HTH-type transcriptional regulator, cell division transcriptional repressor
MVAWSLAQSKSVLKWNTGQARAWYCDRVGVPKQNNNLVGKRVKKARLQAKPKLSQDALSGKLAARGVTIDRAGIAKIESGIRYVSDFEVKALAAALGVSVSWLLELER